MCSFKLKMYQNHFRLGLCPDSALIGRRRGTLHIFLPFDDSGISRGGNNSVAGPGPQRLLKQLCTYSEKWFCRERVVRLWPTVDKFHEVVASQIHQTATQTYVSTDRHINTSYLADELKYTADFKVQRPLRSTTSLSLNVHRTRLSTVGDQALPAAAARTSAPTCHVHTLYVCFPRSPQGFPLMSCFP